MADEEPPRPKGLSVGFDAPIFDIDDINGNNINLIHLLKAHNGVLIDFFRGNW